jgi:aryl-alcohol dehydrogenase-like predicted oxidoreductase
MTDRKSKLAVGTANFGLVYGAANVNGRLSDAKLNQIMKVAKHSSVTTFDTAQGYGDSEERLGSFLNDKTQVITKIEVCLKEHSAAPSLRQLLKKSLRRLRCDQIYAVLLHHPEVLVGQNGAAIVRELQHLKGEGLVKKVGISIYDPEILNDVIKFFHLDIVQLPFNIFDRTVYLTGWAEKLKQQDIEIHARSVFC